MFVFFVMSMSEISLVSHWNFSFFSLCQICYDRFPCVAGKIKKRKEEEKGREQEERGKESGKKGIRREVRGKMKVKKKESEKYEKEREMGGKGLGRKK